MTTKNDNFYVTIIFYIIPIFIVGSNYLIIVKLAHRILNVPKMFLMR